jgi:hypothetical protein
MNRYTDINILKSQTGKQYYQTTKYPEIPLDISDIYVISTVEDRYDILANQYYGDPTLWWIIPIANNIKQDSYYPPLGIQLRIPINISSILAQYNQINRL